MKSAKLLTAASIFAAAILGSIAIAVPTQDRAAQQEMQLPPGWTQQDVQNMMEAGTPGEHHEFLAAGEGTWEGKTTMWMYPGAEPIVSTATSTVKPIMDGRFVQVEWSGEMPGMGQYKGLGLYGYNNVTRQFEAAIVDNMGTTMGRGEGERSADGKSITWEYTYTCPITHKPTSMREVQTYNGEEMTLEMHGMDPKSGKEFKSMVIEMKRTGNAPARN